MSTGGGVAITFSGDSKGAEAALLNLQKQVQRLTDDLKKQQQQSKQGADEEVKRAKFMENLKRNSIRLELQMEKEAASESKRIADEKQRWLTNLKAKSAKLELQMEKDALREKDKALRAAEKASLEAEKQGGLLESQIGTLSTIAAGYIGIQAYASGLNRLLEDELELRRRISAAQVETARPQGAFLRNLGVVSKDELQASLAKVREISRKTGVSEGNLYGAGATALAAKGGLTNEQALDTLGVAARAVQDSPEELTQTAGGLLDLQKITGKGADYNLGLLLQASEQARVSTIGDIASNLLPGAIAVKGRGGTAEEALALATTMTQAAVDDSGLKSATAVSQLANQATEFLPEQDTYGYKDGRRVRLRKGTGLKSPMERIRRLQDDPRLREEFLSQAHFQEKSDVPIIQLLTKGSEQAQMLERNIKANQGVTGADATKFIDTINSVDLQQQANFVRRGEQVSQELKLTDPVRAAKDAAYSNMANYQESMGTPWLLRTRLRASMMLGEVMGQSPAETALQELGQNARNASKDANFEKRPMNNEEKRIYDATMRMVKIMESIDQKIGGGKNIDRHVE